MTDEELSVFLGEATSEDDRERGRRQLVAEARRWWEARSDFREERREARDFYRGRQWNGTIETPEGETKREKDYIEEQGRMAMVMNLVANVVNSVQGQFRQNKSDRQAFATERASEEAVRMMNVARRATRRYNDSDMLEADQFTDHILGGASGFKQSWTWHARLNRYEVTDHALDQNRLFYNLDVRDRRLDGLRIVGELHDVPLAEVKQRFARSKKEAERLEGLYGKRDARAAGLETSSYGFEEAEADDFFTAPVPGMCRVLEIWTPVYEWVRTGLDPMFEVIPEGYGEVTLPENEITRIQNRRREQGLPLLELDEPRYEPHWHYYFLTPEGHPLDEGATPYDHGSHPYSLGMAMLIDGETWGLVSNIKDPQRWLNRLLAHIDHAMGTGAKGAVAYDRSFMEENGLDQADVDDWYTSADGSLGVDPPQGKDLNDFVERFVAEKLPTGYVDLIPTLTNFVEQISGVTKAMQGFEPKSGTPAALYQQQVQQASMNIFGYLESYFETLRRKDRKTLQLIQQAASERRTYAQQSFEQPIEFRPDAVRGIDFDVSIGNVADTATYRMLWEDYLKSLMDQGVIPPEIYLQESSHPRAESLLHRLENYKQEQLMQQAALQEAAGEDESSDDSESTDETDA